jgi:hypothetical protein
MVSLRLAEALELLEDGGRSQAGYADIRRADGAGGFMRLRLEPINSLARLEIRDPALASKSLRGASLDTADGRTTQARRMVARGGCFERRFDLSIPRCGADAAGAGVGRAPSGDAVDQQVRYFGRKSATILVASRRYEAHRKVAAAGNIDTPLMPSA